MIIILNSIRTKVNNKIITILNKIEKIKIIKEWKRE
jgi:hypothetical protein